MTEDRAISLNAAIKCVESHEYTLKAAAELRELPPVTPNDEEMAMQYQRGYIDGFHEGKATFEPKTGHWFVDERPESDKEIICSNCEQPIFKYHKMDFDYRPKYCPNCGARMYEPQEGANE